MPLLIVPLVILILLGLWPVLLPLSIWQRYRLGKARRKAWPWLVNLNTRPSRVKFMPSFSTWPGFVAPVSTTPAGVIRVKSS